MNTFNMFLCSYASYDYEFLYFSQVYNIVIRSAKYGSEHPKAFKQLQLVVCIE